MPIYEYLCKDCEEKFELLQAITDEPLEICEKCGGKLKKLISKSGVAVEYRNGRDQYEHQIKPEVDRIVKKIKSGDEDTAADIFGLNK